MRTSSEYSLLTSAKLLTRFLIKFFVTSSSWYDTRAHLNLNMAGKWKAFALFELQANFDQGNCASRSWNTVQNVCLNKQNEKIADGWTYVPPIKEKPLWKLVFTVEKRWYCESYNWLSEQTFIAGRNINLRKMCISAGATSQFSISFPRLTIRTSHTPRRCLVKRL